MATRMLISTMILFFNHVLVRAQVWEKVESTSTQDLIEVQFMGSIGYALASNGQILYSADEGVTWTKKKTVGMKAFDMQFTDELTGYILGNTSVFKTTDGAESWEAIFSRSTPFALMHVFGNNHLIVSSAWSDDDQFYYTENDFDHIILDTALHFATSMTFINALEGHANDMHGGVLFTKDGGKTWRHGPHPLRGIWSIREAVYLDDETAILANSERNYSLQNGKDTLSYTWKESMDDESIKSEFIYINQLFVASNKDVYAVGYVGANRTGFVAHTSDLAKTWTLDTLLDYQLMSITEVGELDFVVTGASGAVYRTSEKNSVSEPTKIQRISIWPNPVNNELKIQAVGQVQSIKLFQLDGTLVQYSSNSQVLDVTTVPKGVYLLRVETDEGVHNERIFKQ